jgi:hypothetical protein
MANKKLSELPVASSISPANISVLVGNDIDYQYSFTTLLNFIAANLAVGSKISFGTIIPQNTTGNNSDVFFKTGSPSIYQKLIGEWTLVYTIPTGNGPDGTLLYGNGIPGGTTGADNDSYIDTSTGLFYLKTSGNWAQVFSMATGPQGPQGAPGANGTNGTNANTILNGSTNPSNTLGNNGDYYINNGTLYFFGPKVAGVWPPGNSIVGPPYTSYNRSFTAITGLTIDWQNDLIDGVNTYVSALGNNLFHKPAVYATNGVVNDDGSFESTGNIDYSLIITQSADNSQIIKVAFDWAVSQTGIIAF